MQNEITELRNQVRTLKRIVCLVCCLFGVLMFTGCTESQPTTFIHQYNELTGEWEVIPIYRQVDSPSLRKQGPTSNPPDRDGPPDIPDETPSWWDPDDDDSGSDDNPSPNN